MGNNMPEFVDDRYCLCCGEKNPLGFNMKFRYEGDKLFSRVALPKEFQGFSGIIHGGVLGTLLDEMMVNLYWLRGEKAVTVEYQVRLRAPCPVDTEIFLSAWNVGNKRRIQLTASEAKLANGTVVAEGTAKCLKVD